MALRILGIDPGSRITGWGIIEENSGVLQLVDCGAIRAQSKRTAAASSDFSMRLAYIYQELRAIIAYHKPHEAAIEQVFTAKNAASALKLGQARGVAVAACAGHDISVSDYEPTLVKKTIVGVGRAEKSQVAYMVKILLNTKQEWPLDTSDALAVALCHSTMRKFALKSQTALEK